MALVHVSLLCSQLSCTPTPLYFPFGSETLPTRLYLPTEGLFSQTNPQLTNSSLLSHPGPRLWCRHVPRSLL